MHMEFVETQHLAVAQQCVQRRAQGIVQQPVTVHALVQAGKKIMEVQAFFRLDRHCLEETVQQPALAAAHRAVQVKAAWFAAWQAGKLLGHGLNDPALVLAELIATAACLVFEPCEQFALVGGGGSQALTQLAQRGRDPGRQKLSSLGKGRSARSLPQVGPFNQ
ncbi:hypothetical protein D3C79_752960 [compost metagenome]